MRIQRSTTTVRAMMAADVPGALRLWTRTEGICPPDPLERAALRAYLRQNAGLSVAATAGGRLVGALLCGHDGRRGHLAHLAVAPAHRRRGLGRALVARALEGLAARGIPKCHIFVLRGNATALRFWRAAGWRVRRDVIPLSIDLARGSGRDR